MEKICSLPTQTYEMNRNYHRNGGNHAIENPKTVILHRLTKESKPKQHTTVRNRNKKYANIKSSGYGYGGRYQPRSSQNAQRKNRNTTSTVRKTMDLNSKIHYNRRMTALLEEKHVTQSTRTAFLRRSGKKYTPPLPPVIVE